MKSFPAFGILFGARNRLGELRSLLESNSGLPGPRANLELGYTFASSVAALHLQEWQWQFLVESASTGADKAPENTPSVYLVFCALLALGTLYGTGLPRPRRRAALSAIKSAASDTRWRVREACAMALQRIGEQDAEELRTVVTEWMEGASFLEMRAIAAGLAHPPILDKKMSAFSLEISRRILTALSRAEPAARRQEPFKVLRQGMGYALSVFVAHAPAEGFTVMRKTAAVRDRDLAWIIRENLKKKRLSDEFSKESEQVALILEEVNA